MKKYSKYKASGVVWLGEIPSDWNRYRIKFCFNSINGGVWGEDPIGDTNDIVCIRVADFDYTHGVIDTSNFTTRNISPSEQKSRLLKKGDLLIEKSGGGELSPVGRVVKFDLDIKAVCSNFINRLNTKKQFNPDFLNYLNRYLYSRGITESCINQTTGIQNLKVGEFVSNVIFTPSRPEQHTIVRFLDYKTGQIDSFIANRQKQIELLKEQKACIINNAVTKGINPNAKMKDSGIEWIGEVPEHWEILKLKYIIKTMASGVSVNSTDDPAEPFEFGILKTSCVYTGEFNPNENKKILESEFDRMACQVKGNSIIMSRMNTPELVGANGFVDKDYKNLFLPDRLWQTVFFKKAQIVPRWLSYFLASHRFRTLISSLATGTSASMKNITQEDVLGSSICLPTIKEQNEMLVFFENETSIIDTLISKYQKQIDLMQEYRTSLISQAVTGKIDVREWHPKKAVTA